MIWQFWHGGAHPCWHGWAFFGMGGRILACFGHFSMGERTHLGMGRRILAWVDVFWHGWAPPDTCFGMGGRRFVEGWLRASALTCRLISLVGVKWSCLPIYKPAFSPRFVEGRVERFGCRF
jgi:hypothetical protein